MNTVVKALAARIQELETRLTKLEARQKPGPKPKPEKEPVEAQKEPE